MEQNVTLDTLVERTERIRKSVEKFEKVKQFYPEYLVKQYERLSKDLERVKEYQTS